MKNILVLSAALFVVPMTGAVAADLGGSSALSGSAALALAALVGEHSPAVGAADKRLLTAYLAGKAGAPHRHGHTIKLTADTVTCRTSNVDITWHSCDLSFGKKKTSLKGREAHELFATLIEAGIQAEGAAGSMIAGITKLGCTIEADAVADKAGGGAQCSYNPD